MKLYAVIDTNVIVSALITDNPNSPPKQIIDLVFDGEIVPLYHNDILDEYQKVLSRPKFNINYLTRDKVLTYIINHGIEIFPTPSNEYFVDMSDLIFYEVTMDANVNEKYLVTGNIKHYPRKDFIVTPKELIEIINRLRLTTSNMNN